jgi:predicted ATPase
VEGVARAVAEALGVPLTGAAPVAAAGGAIETRGRVLIVLDTFDVHLPDAAATVGAWSARAPDASFLLTSRTLTGLPGERELRLESLPSAAAVRLFADRAREARPDFELGPENEADVARICSELEGLPLAIELAAARARILKPAEMVRKLGQKFQLLRSVRKDTAPRQQTLTAAIEWSEEQLAPWELSALRQMTVFCGGCNPEAADAVIDLSGHPGAPGGAAAARALVARSLLSVRESDQATRFVMSRALHEHSLAQLPADGPEGRKAAESRHTAWCLKLAEYLDSQSGQREARDLARAEVENFFAVQDRLGGQEDRALDVARVVASTRTTLLWHGPLKEGLERLVRARGALGLLEDPETRMRLMLGEARLQKAMGRWKEALEVAEEAAAFGKATGARGVLSEIMWEVAYLAGSFSDYVKSDAALAESEAIAREAGHRVRLMSCLHLRTVRMRGLGDVAGSLALAREALEIARGMPSREDALAESLNVVANALGEASDPAGAFAMYREAIQIDERLGNEAGRATRLANSGDVLLEMGDPEGAMDFYTRAGDVDRRLGRQAYLTYGLIRQSSVLRVQGNHAGALALLDRASEGLGRLDSPQLRAIWTLRRLEALLAMGDDAGVVRLFEESAREALIDQDLPKVLAANVLGARALVRLGRAAEARELLARVLKDGVPGSIPDVDRFALFAVRALVADAAGEKAEALGLAREAAEMGAKLKVNYGERNSTLMELWPVVERIARG